MPQFDSLPPADSQRTACRLIRTPTARPFVGLVISEELTGCRTHFVGNRTVPCEAPHCEPCANGIAWRWHGYLLVLVESTQETVIFEMTAISSAPFTAYYERYGTLRGAHFRATRLNQRSNGRVQIQAKPADLARVKLPPNRDLKKLLCHIWNIPPNQVDQPTKMTRPPAKDLTVDKQRPEIYDPSGLPTKSDKDFIRSIARKVGSNRHTPIEPTGT